MKPWVHIVLLALASCGDQNNWIAEEALREGNAAYQDSAYVAAVEKYATASFDPKAMHNSGKSNYRANDHGNSVADLTTVVEMTEDPELLADAYHDLGNARLMHSNWADSMRAMIEENIRSIALDGDDIAAKLRKAVVRDSLKNEKTRLVQLSDSALAQSVIAFKQALRRDPADEDTRYNLALSKHLLPLREKERNENGDEKKNDQELSERAKALIKQADELVDAYKFKQALELLQLGMKEDPTLAKEEEYVKKLEVVTKAAEAS